MHTPDSRSRSSRFRGTKLFVALFLLVSLSKSADTTTGLQAWWKLDETAGTVAADAAGTAQNGTLYGGAVWSSNTRYSGGILLDGVDDYIVAPNVINPGSTDFTAAAWIRLDTRQGTATQTILAQEGTNGRLWLYCKNDSGGVLATYVGGTSLATEVIIQPGTWYHVAVTRSGSTVNLYVNGGLEASATASIASETGAMRLGRHKSPGTANEEWAGAFDDARIYNRALTLGDIRELYFALPPPVRTVNVSTSAQLATALANAQAGDHIVLATGVTYSAAGGFSISVSGTNADPIVIRSAGSPAGYNFAANVTSKLTVQAAHVWIDQVYFSGPTAQIAFASGSGAVGDYNVVRRSWFRETKVKDVIYPTNGCDYGKIEFCYFREDPTNTSSSHYIGDEGSGALSAFWHVRYCYFHTSSALNTSFSAIRIGVINIDTDVYAYWTVENCLFEEVDGNELLQVKSSGHTFKNLTFVNCDSRPTLRWGNDNRFLGFWLENTIGLFVRGMYHELNGIKIINGTRTAQFNLFSGSCEAADAGGPAGDVNTPPVGSKFPNAVSVLVAGYDAPSGTKITLGKQNDVYCTLPARNNVLEGVPGSLIDTTTYGYNTGTTNPPASGRKIYTPFKIAPSQVGPNAN